MVHVNYTGAVSVGLAVAAQFRRQGHGKLVVLSSVAGERVRKANFVYGSSKAALDAFAQGLGDSLAGSGASVLVVRPGFVHSRMTQGMKAAPFATTPTAVAKATAAALRSGKRTIWVPGTLRPVFSIFRHLPGWAWRRLPLGLDSTVRRVAAAVEHGEAVFPAAELAELFGQDLVGALASRTRPRRWARSSRPTAR